MQFAQADFRKAQNSVKEGSAPAQFGTDGAYARASRGFMGKEWDGGDIAFRTEVWEAALRVAKPGAYLLAFGGTRTFHRMAVAIEDAGWEIRDTVMWVYGSGFPKSHDEFMTQVIAANNIRLPVLPSGLDYQYDVDGHRLVIVNTADGKTVE